MKLGNACNYFSIYHKGKNNDPKSKTCKKKENIARGKTILRIELNPAEIATTELCIYFALYKIFS